MEDFGPIGNEQVINQKSKKSLFIVLAVLVVLVAVLGFFMLQMSKPRFVFDKAIDELLSFEASEDFNSLKVNGDLTVSVNEEGAEGNEVINLINDAKISYNVEFDKAQEQELIGLKITAADDELLDGKIKIDAAAQKMYLKVATFFDKPIELTSADLSSEDFEFFDATELTFGQKVNGAVAVQILRKEIKAELKDEYFSAEKVTVDGENLTKNTLKMTGEQLNTVIKNVCDNLSANEEFLSCFEDSQEVKNSLSDFLISVEDMQLEDLTNIEISCYIAGFLKEVKRVDITFEDNTEKTTVEIKAETAEDFAYNILVDDEKTASGKVKVVMDNQNYLFETSAVQDGVETAIKVSGSVIYDETISEFDTSNAVKSDELTDEDYMAIFNNFMNSKLYEIIEDMSGTGSMLDSSNVIEDSYTGDDFSSTVDEASEAAGQLNVLQTYNDQIVKFNIPDGYECYSSDSDAYKLFEKEIEDDYLDVDVSIDYDTMDEYIEFVKDIMTDRQNDGSYANLNLSEDEIEVNGNIFKRMIYTYDYVYSNGDTAPNVDVYIAHEIDSENLYVVEISGPEMISDQDLAQFLLIEK